ncbi:MAG: tetraacyldisaccharide 4'-kinase [Phycisphaerae bacterium]
MLKAWYRLISAEKLNVAGYPAMAILKALACLYRYAVCRRNDRFDRRLNESVMISRPVLSVGNITAGGTGKTPIVILLCEMFNDAGLKVAVLTRGYAAKDGFADEPEEIKLACPSAKVYVNPSRVKGAEEALAAGPPDIFVMDDGYQHRQLHRDINLLVIDASCPFGFGRLLPAGLLREPLSSIGRADICFITKGEMVSEERLGEIEQQVHSIKNIPIVRTRQAPAKAVLLDGTTLSPAELCGKKAFAFCGIGNPKSFFNMLRNAGIELACTKAFPDHYSYSAEEIKQMLYKAGNVDIILMTRKDYVKVSRLSDDAEIAKASGKMGYIELGLKITKNSDALSDVLLKIGEMTL